MPRVIAVPEDGSLAEARGELIPEGDYFNVRIEKCEEAQTKKTGDDMYVLTLRILDEGPAQNRTIRAWVVLTWNSRYSLLQLNASIGLPTTTDDGLYVGDPNEYLGQTTSIVVEHGTNPNDDSPTNNVKRYIVPKGDTKPSPVKASGRQPLPRRGAPAKPPVTAVPDLPEEKVELAKDTNSES